jgi:hypothetical protein
MGDRGMQAMKVHGVRRGAFVVVDLPSKTAVRPLLGLIR